MKRNITIYYLLALAIALGLGACSEPTDSIPAGMGQVEIYLTAPYHKATRASGEWLDPDPERPEELIYDYWVVFVNDNSNSDNYKKVEEIARGTAGGAEEHSFRFFLPPGNYRAYAFANLQGTIYTSTTASLQLSTSLVKVYTPKEATEDDPSTFVITPLAAITKGETMPDLTNARLATTNGWTEDIPMSSNINGQTITVVEAENQSFEIELIRAMAKMEFTFFNNTQQDMDIVGFEISPLAKDYWVSLLEPETPTILTAYETTAYSVDVPLSTSSPNLPTDSELAAPIFYVNETNASAISTEEPNKNQYSIRIKAKRYLASGTTGEVEYRYGITVNSEDGGFDYIRRNDWIKIPIRFNDWTFRVEALPFPPIAGFQARVLSADALSITFNSGGYIFLRPMFRKNDDPVGVWRGFDDSNVTFELKGEPYIVNGVSAVEQEVTSSQPYAWTTPATGVAESLTPIESENTEDPIYTGIVMTGDLNIFEQRFIQLDSGDIVGKLINDDTKNGQVTVTIKLILDGFAYQFNYNILKQ
jgi:hypothetical protein